MKAISQFKKFQFRAIFLLGLFDQAKALATDLESCEAKAHTTFQKGAVELGMASILGLVSELEAESKREHLQRNLESQKGHCKHWAARASLPASADF